MYFIHVRIRVRCTTTLVSITELNFLIIICIVLFCRPEFPDYHIVLYCRPEFPDYHIVLYCRPEFPDYHIVL
jgi:hypothetical protein